MPRLIEILLAAFGLIVLSPILIGAAVAVRLNSKGPALFRQIRVGQNGRDFEMYKFRSMVSGPNSGSLVTVSGDSRVTSVGKFLRKSKIDEFPQLWNVLKGDMSIVGPRPEVRHYLEFYPEDGLEVMLSLKPGITDPASIKFRHEEEILAAQDDPQAYYKNVILPQKCAIYKEYTDQKSFMFDIKTIIQTFVAISN